MSHLLSTWVSKYLSTRSYLRSLGYSRISFLRGVPFSVLGQSGPGINDLKSMPLYGQITGVKIINLSFEPRVGGTHLASQWFFPRHLVFGLDMTWPWL